MGSNTKTKSNFIKSKRVPIYKQAIPWLPLWVVTEGGTWHHNPRACAKMKGEGGVLYDNLYLT